MVSVGEPGGGRGPRARRIDEFSHVRDRAGGRAGEHFDRVGAEPKLRVVPYRTYQRKGQREAGLSTFATAIAGGGPNPAPLD
jgi:hypothetical protein